MNVKNVFMWFVVVFAGILCGITEVSASTWVGIQPVSYGWVSWKPPVIIENGDMTVHEFTFQGIFGSSSACDWIPKVTLNSPFSSDQLFFSLDSQQYVTEKLWPIEHLLAGDTRYFSFTVYVSNPRLEPTLPGEYYRLSPNWQPRPADSGGGIGIVGSIGGAIFLQVTPEPTTLVLLGLGGMLIRKKVFSSSHI